MANQCSKPLPLDSGSRCSIGSTDGSEEFLPCVRRVSSVLVSTEQVLGVTATGLAVGLFLLIVAAVYVTPAYFLVNNGQNYGGISGNPFRSSGSPFGHRILSPFLAYYLGLRGPNFIFFPLLVSVLFLAAIYWYFRKSGYAHVGALVASSTMAFSSPILFLLHFQGYTDILSHLLLFGCLVLRRSRVLWAVMIALSCLNHESTLFSIPWVVFLRTRCFGVRLLSRMGLLRLSIDLLLVTLAILAMVVFRKLCPLENTALGYEAYMDLLPHNWLRILRYGGLGIFMAFKAFWFLPITALLTVERGNRMATAILFALMFFAGVGQLSFGSDTSRHLGHAFPIILYSLEMILMKKGHTNGVLQVISLLVVVNFFVPEYYVGQENAWPFLPSPVSLLLWVFGLDPWGLSFAPWT